MVQAVKRNEILVKKILKEIEDINLFTGTMTENDFYHDLKTQKAVVMSLINIGELSKSFSDDFIAVHEIIPWKKVQSMRNIAAHKYETLDMQIVWDTIQISIKELKAELITA